MKLTWVILDLDRPDTKSTVAYIPRDVAGVVAGADDARAYGDDDGCGAVRVDEDGASSRRAMKAPVDFRCAEATSRFRDSNFRGCVHRHRLPYHQGNPSSGFRRLNYLHLKHQ